MTDTKLSNHDRTGRIHEPVDRAAERGTPGSPVSKSGRHHIREFPCPMEGGPHFLAADAKMWIPDWDIDLKIAGIWLYKAFGEWKGAYRGV
jgi:hypothetical protein